MALNFPNNPSDGDIFGEYQYDANLPAWRSIAQYGTLPCGAVIPWASTTVPAGWLLCDGAAVSRSTYSSLYAALGGASSPWGQGDGSSTFNVPDLRGRIPVGKNGGSFGTIGATGGVESVTLTEAQMPSHTHIQNAHNHSHRQWIFNGAGASGTHYGFGYASGTGGAADTSAAGSSGEIWFGNYPATATNQNTGGGQAHTNLQPYAVLNYIIKTTVSVAPSDTELAVRMGEAEATVTAQASTVSGYNTRLTNAESYISTVKSSYASRNIYVQVDTTNRSSGTSWTLGPTFPTLSYKANSKIKMSYHAPMRNDSGSWGGIYIEPQIQFNGGTWQSLGSTGHDMMTLSGADIATYHNEILVTPGIGSDFTAAFRFYFRAYDSTVYFNNGSNHDINVVSGTATIMSGDNGNQHYFHIIVEEFATG